ncbi:MAG: hypothetical protein AAF772_20590, partial [Acidobacteriota bacterium]
AVAFDADGRPIDRTVQWLNLPQPPARATAVIEGGTRRADGLRHGAVARVRWESLAGAAPRAVDARFDGAPLAVEAPTTIALPAFDPAALHVLRVVLRFDDGVEAVAETIVGGRFGDDVASALTALPLLGGENRTPKVAALDGLVRFDDGAPATVAAVERGPVELVVVRDSGALDAIEMLIRLQRRDLRLRGGFAQGPPGNDWLRRAFPLRDAQYIRLLSARAEDRSGVRSTFAVFDSSPVYTPADAGLLWLLARAEREPPTADRQTLAYAVTVAGLSSTRRTGRRAVLLVLGPAPQDQSRFAAEAARRYLRELGIPLYVWQIGRPDADADAAARSAAWQPDNRIGDLLSLRRATDALASDLDRQFVAWVVGKHLPRSLSLVTADALPDNASRAQRRLRRRLALAGR